MLYTKMFHGYDKMKHTKYAKNNEIYENLFSRNIRKCVRSYALTEWHALPCVKLDE